MGLKEEILGSICEENMSESEYENIKMIASQLDRDYILIPAYGIEDNGQVGWFCALSNQMASMLFNEKSLIDKWCVCCPLHCEKDLWRSLFVRKVDKRPWLLKQDKKINKGG